MARPVQIDRDKFRAEVRKLGNGSIFSILDEPIELLSQRQLHKLAKQHFDLKQLRPDAEKTAKPDLLTEVRRFERASLEGQYYESFSVNSCDVNGGEVAKSVCFTLKLPGFGLRFSRNHLRIRALTFNSWKFVEFVSANVSR